MNIWYTPHFIKSFKSLPKQIQVLSKEKEIIFRKSINHEQLCTHVLKGKMKGFYSFRVNYSYRIMFAIETNGDVTFIDIGTHSVYR